jgi:hypothetical protein
MPLSAGTRLGPYDILAPLDAGGMAIIWLLENFDAKVGLVDRVLHRR